MIDYNDENYYYYYFMDTILDNENIKAILHNISIKNYVKHEYIFK